MGRENAGTIPVKELVRNLSFSKSFKCDPEYFFVRLWKRIFGRKKHDDITVEVNRHCIVCDKYAGGDILCPECLAKAEAKGR